MDETSSILTLFADRVRFCREQRLAYQGWLGFLSPLKWLTVGGSVVLSGAAAITILQGVQVFGVDWELVSAIMAATAGALTALHANLRCDEHQTECNRIINAFHAIELAYEAAQSVAPAELAAKRDEIEERLETLVESLAAAPSAHFRKRAADAMRRLKPA